MTTLYLLLMNRFNSSLLQLPSSNFLPPSEVKTNLQPNCDFNFFLRVVSSNAQKESYEWLTNHLFKVFPWLTQPQPKKELNFNYESRFPKIMDSNTQLEISNQNLRYTSVSPLNNPNAVNLSSNNLSFNIDKQRFTEFTLQESKIDAYRRRNVYKSIIRHMLSYIQGNKLEITEMLITNGYLSEEIDKAFAYVAKLNEMDKQKGKSKRPQHTINKILKSKNIYIYILKETLYSMLNSWKSEKTSKVMKKNLYIYDEVCTIYYNRCIELISQKS